MSSSPASVPAAAPLIVVVGGGRVGTALAGALASAGVRIAGPLGRDDVVPDDAEAVILAVPESAIVDAVARVPPGPVVAHCSASAPLALLGPRESFILHPLLAVTPETSFTDAGCVIAASSRRARAVAERLARALGMRLAHVRDEDRALYHAAASMAANFLVTLEGEAERLLAGVGVERPLVAPLVRSALAAWEARGASAALTGPIARGDVATVARQRAAVAERAPELIALWDALADRTRVLARDLP